MPLLQKSHHLSVSTFIQCKEQSRNAEGHLTRLHSLCLLAPTLKKEDYVRKKEERTAKEELDKKKAEEAAKMAEEKKKNDEEKRLKAKKKEEEERREDEARKKAKVFPDIICSCFDVLFRPIEDKMDTILGSTIDPFTGRRGPCDS